MKRSPLIIAIPFFSFIFIITIMIFGLPSLPKSDRELITFPRKLKDLKSLGLVLSRYKSEYYWRIFTLITTSYIFLQSFMIPGSVVFSVLLGYLYPFTLAICAISFCSAVGASFCFTLSGLIGESFLKKRFPDQVETCRRITYSYRKAMFICIFLLRVCPFIPNWSVNIISPIVNVKLTPFFWGTFFGVIPLSLVFVKAGTVLQELTDLGVTSLASVYTLGLYTLISVIPFIFRKRLRQLLE